MYHLFDKLSRITARLKKLFVLSLGFAEGGVVPNAVFLVLMYYCFDGE